MGETASPEGRATPALPAAGWFATARALVRSFLTDAGKQALGNLLWLSVWVALTQVCTIGVLLVLTRSLGPQGYGGVALGLTLYTYLVMIGSLCSASVVVREGARRPQDLDAITTAYLVLTAVSAGLACGLTVVGAWLVPVSAGERWLLALIAVGTIPASVNLAPLFIVHHRQARNALVTFVAELAALAAVLALGWSDALSLPVVGVVYAGKWALTAAGQFLTYQATVRPLRWSHPGAYLSKLLRSSWPILFATLVYFVPLGAGVFVVRVLRGDAEAGIYGLAYQGAGAYYTFGALAVQVIQPHVLGAHGLEPTFLRKLSFFVVVFLGGLAALAAAGGWIVIRFLLPPAYFAAVVPLLLLVAAALLLLLAGTAHLYLLRFHDERFILAAHLAAAVLYAVTCPALVTWAGAPGAALGAVAATLAGAALCLGRARSRLRTGAALGKVNGDRVS
jgi:O-antigen/teichoic acid export membrane protein